MQKGQLKWQHQLQVMWQSSSRSLEEIQHCFWKSNARRSLFHPLILAPTRVSLLGLGSLSKEERRKWDLSIPFTSIAKISFPTFPVQGRFFLAFNQVFSADLCSGLWRMVNMFSETCVLLLTSECLGVNRNKTRVSIESKSQIFKVSEIDFLWH